MSLSGEREQDSHSSALLLDRIDHELGRSETFDHDALGRLTSWRPSWVEPTTYEYDAIGNLTRIGEV
ncbi:MAG: RHS repeat protein, partial [Sandaracinaceae bacterium]|nr:RHS repeat protein [Sandaracinaceae bacterium]